MKKNAKKTHFLSLYDLQWCAQWSMSRRLMGSVGAVNVWCACMHECLTFWMASSAAPAVFSLTLRLKALTDHRAQGQGWELSSSIPPSLKPRRPIESCLLTQKRSKHNIRGVGKTNNRRALVKMSIAIHQPLGTSGF